VTTPERTAVVLAGGGERVVAWEVGVLAGLADRGFDARRAGDETLERYFRRRAMGVILTGYGVDGSAGALAIHAAGGVVLVQDPLTCDAPAMALATIAAAAHDVVVPLEALGATLSELVGDLGAERSFLRELAAERFPRHPARAGPAA